MSERRELYIRGSLLSRENMNVGAQNFGDEWAHFFKKPGDCDKNNLFAGSGISLTLIVLPACGTVFTSPCPFVEEFYQAIQYIC